MRNLHNALLLKQLYILKQISYSYTDIRPSQLELEPLRLPSDMDALRKITLQCHLCQLSKSRKRVVFGDGNSSADLMFVGEGPGALEDESGRVFVGKSGQMLTRIIQNVLNLKRQEVYIANIIKCRPQGNRTPTPTEAFTCRPYLLKQIEIVKPKIIVALGSTAYRYLTNDQTPISKVRGGVIDTKEYKLISTYHPSYLLRNPSFKKDTFEDMKLAKELLARLQN